MGRTVRIDETEGDLIVRSPLCGDIKKGVLPGASTARSRLDVAAEAAIAVEPGTKTARHLRHLGEGEASFAEQRQLAGRESGERAADVGPRPWTRVQLPVGRAGQHQQQDEQSDHFRH